MNHNSIVNQINSLPSMLSELVPKYRELVKEAFSENVLESCDQISIFGCGDSFFAGISSQWFFEAIAGIPANIRTSLQFSRYTDKTMLSRSYKFPVAIGISVSGSSTRTKEAMQGAQQGGLKTVALTARKNKFSEMADIPLLTEDEKYPDPEPNGTPGIRTFYSNLLVLILLAQQISLHKRRLDKNQHDKINSAFDALPNTLDAVIKKNTSAIQGMVEAWSDADKYVFVGAGPNYGAALFSSAKMIEASGDFALAQETEEWAHLNYYNSETNTPTFFISNGDNDYSRIKEVLSAAKSIGRRTALISPYTMSELDGACDFALTIPKSTHDSLSVFYTCALSSIFAALRANALNSTYFRENNTVEISRIRSSEQEVQA